MTVVPGFIDCHNHAGGDDAALRSAGRQSVRSRVRHASAASSTSCARRRAADAAGHVGRGLLLRRHQAEGQARAQRPRSRRGLDASIRWSCATAAATRRSTTARRSRWPASPRTRRTRRAARSIEDANGELNGRVTDRARGAVQQGRHAAARSRRSRARSASATASRTSRSSSRATA